MRGVGPDQAWAPRRRRRAEIAARVPRRKSNRAEAACCQMREILANAAPQPQHVGQRRVDRRGARVEAKVAVDSRGQLGERRKDWTTGGEARCGTLAQSRDLRDS